MTDSGPSRQTTGSLRRLSADFPGVEFRGGLRVGHGPIGRGEEFDLADWPPLVSTIRAALEPTRNPIEWRGMNANLRPGERFPPVVIDLSGFPTAHTKPTGRGSITIDIGLPLMLGSAPYLFRTVELLIRELSDRKRIDLNELQERFVTTPPSPRIEQEILSLLALLHLCASTDWAVIPWSEGKTATIYMIVDVDRGIDWHASQMSSPTLLHMVQLMSLHEIAHWHMERLTTSSGLSEFEGNTQIGLEEWLSQRHLDPDCVLATPFFFQFLRNGLGDAHRRRFWVKELCADQMAVSAALQMAGNGRRLHRDARMRWYAEIAMYFFMLELWEVHQELEEGEADYSVHPPAKLRRSFSTFVLQMQSGLSERDFHMTEWGAGFAVALMTRTLMAWIVQKLDQEPDRINHPPRPFLGDGDVNLTLIRN